GRCARATKSVFLATKSVSQFSSSSARPACATSPFAAVRPARLLTSFAPLMRRISTALSKSPSDSSSAFLQSIMPAAVRSRSFLTSAAVKLAMTLSRCRFGRAAVGWARGRPRSGGGLLLGLAALQQLALPLGERLVGGHRARLRLVVGAARPAGPGDEALGDRVRDHAGEQRGRPDGV